MLPFFQVISPNAKIKMQTEVPAKPRRKKIDVPIHRTEKQSDESLHKTFSANHPTRSKHKKADVSEHDYKKSLQLSVQNNLLTDTDDRLNAKISRKYLIKENERLNEENTELQEKLASMDVYLNKKNNRFKEKLNTLHTINEEVVNENNIIKAQYQELYEQFKICQNELALSKNCQKCEDLNAILDKSKADYTLLKKTNLELLEDENMLKNVVYRLNVQLERYQENLHKHRIKFNSRSYEIPRPEGIESVTTVTVENKNVLPEDHWNHPHTPISWGKVNIHTLGPLLDAYQGTIAEKDEIIQNYELDFTNFTERLKEIISENESLHKLLNEDDNCSKKLGEDIDNLKAELKSAKEQNDLLIKKCALKQDKIEEILKCYEQKVDQMKRDYKVLHEEYCKSRTDIAALKEKNKSLTDVQDEFKNERQQYIPISVHTVSVNECKKWYEELKQQYEHEKTKLKDNINSLNCEILELTNKITTLSNEKIEYENKIKNAEKQTKKGESKLLDLTHTLNEVQLSRGALRKQLHKAMEFARDLVTEQESLLKALNQRQQENKAVKRLGSDIANRMATLRNQLKSVQKEAFQELSTVEQRIQEKDSLISSLKQDHVQEIDRLKQIIKEKDERNVLFKENTSIPMPHYLLFRDRNLYQ